MKSWSSFVRSTIKELRSGSEVPDYFGNLIPLISRNQNTNYSQMNDNFASYKEDDDLISIDAVQVQNSRQQNRQQPVNNNNANNFFYQINNNNRMSNNNDNYNDIQGNYIQNQQKSMPFYEEDDNNIDDYKNDMIPQKGVSNIVNPNEINDDLNNPNFEPPQQIQKQPKQPKQPQQQLPQSPNRQDPQPQMSKQMQQQVLSDSFNESPNRNLIQLKNNHDTQSTPEGIKQSKDKVYIPETPEMVDYPSSASDVPWQDVPKSSPQPFPSESLINAIDQIGVYDEKQQQTQKQQVQQNQQRQQQQIQQEPSFNDDYSHDQPQQEQSFNEYSHDQPQQEQSFNEYSHDQPQQEQSFNDYNHDQQQRNRFEEIENDLYQEQADDDDNNNSIDDDININEKILIDNEVENSDIAPVPFSERFTILSGGIIDRYWSYIDTEVPRIVPQSKILTSFKASKFVKYKNAMDSFAKKVEGKKHHLRFKQVDQS